MADIKETLVKIAETLGDALSGGATNGNTPAHRADPVAAEPWAPAAPAGGDELVIRLRVGAGQTGNVTTQDRAVREVERALTDLGRSVGVTVQPGSVRIGRS